ncbi:MAG: hypothetical protein QW689_04850 [Nitrososphaerota archaeon]
MMFISYSWYPFLSFPSSPTQMIAVDGFETSHEPDLPEVVQAPLPIRKEGRPHRIGVHEERLQRRNINPL